MQVLRTRVHQQQRRQQLVQEPVLVQEPQNEQPVPVQALRLELEGSLDWQCERASPF